MDTTDFESKRPSASNGSRTPGPGAPGDTGRLTSYLQSVAQISGVATVIAATVYALGVFTLVLPIKNYYNSTFSDAWYAVSVVPKTVVVGYGIKSLTWPSLILTLATMFFALTVIWTCYVVLVGGRHARLTARKPAVSMSAMAFVYTILATFAISGVLILISAMPSYAWLGRTVTGNIVDNALGVFTLLSMALIVPSCTLAAVFFIVRASRYTTQLIRTKTLPRMPLSDLVWSLVKKGLIFTGLSSAVLVSLSLFNDMFGDKSQATMDWFIARALILFGLFVLLCLVLILLLCLKGVQYMMRAITLPIKIKSLPSPRSASFRSLGDRVRQHVRPYSMTLLYSGVLLSVLWLVVSVAVINLELVVLPLVNDISNTSKTNSQLDEWFVPLLIVGACVSGALMYWKDWRGFYHENAYLLSQAEWKFSLQTLLKNVGSRSKGRGFFLSLGVAYVIALASAFLLVELNPPPLSKVHFNELAPQESSKQEHVPDFQGHELLLLAHAEGHWYLVDKDDAALLVIPDQDDKFIKLHLKQQSEPSDRTSFNRWNLL